MTASEIKPQQSFSETRAAFKTKHAAESSMKTETQQPNKKRKAR